MADEKPDEPPTIFIGTCAFRKDATPVFGNMGSRVGRVVVIPAQVGTGCSRSIQRSALQRFASEISADG